MLESEQDFLGKKLMPNILSFEDEKSDMLQITKGM
jgi:hypothetical protein